MYASNLVILTLKIQNLCNKRHSRQSTEITSTLLPQTRRFAESAHNIHKSSIWASGPHRSIAVLFLDFGIDPTGIPRATPRTICSLSDPHNVYDKMVQYWRAAGMTYLKYSNTCAELVRQALKEPIRSRGLDRAAFTMIRGDWEGGKIVQRSKFRSHYLSVVSNPDHLLALTMKAIFLPIPRFIYEALIEPTGAVQEAAVAK